MRARHATYLPITSIIVAIVVLAAVVGIVSFRDIERGQRQVADLLEREARGIIGLLWADIGAELVAPSWQRTRLDTFFENVSAREEIAYLAVVDSEGHVLVHSDPEKVGSMWPEDMKYEVDPNARRLSEQVLTVDGRRIYQYAAPIELHPDRIVGRRPPGMGVARRAGAGMGMRPGRVWGRGPEPGPGQVPGTAPAPGPGEVPGAARPDSAEVLARLADLLERPVGRTETVPLIAVVGLGSSELEAAFLASRNYTIMLSAVLLLVGGVAIYFLFVMAHYRSARTALANMRSYTTNVIESLASGLISVDAEGRVVTLNSAARRLLGTADADVAGRKLDELLRLDPDLEAAGVGAVVRGARAVLETEAKVQGDGGVIPVAVSASSLSDEDGKRAGAVLLLQDLREIEALKEAVERERHLASLGRLAAGVAHEVRNPLSSLKGFAQFLRSKFRPGSQEERYADIMIEEVERLDRVVEELLDFAKPVRPERRPVPANSLVDEALSLLSEDALFRSVEIVKKLGRDLPDVLVDPAQMRQALLNVLLNAMEAMEHGGRLTVETALSKAEGAEPFVSIGVTDTGAGMGEEELARLFEPFYTTKSGGTGLGLTIVTRLLEQNGGHVTVSSVKGEGSTFSMRLPLARPAEGH